MEFAVCEWISFKVKGQVHTAQAVAGIEMCVMHTSMPLHNANQPLRRHLGEGDEVPVPPSICDFNCKTSNFALPGTVFVDFF